MHNNMKEFINCLNEKRYYDAHEALEASWFPRRFEKESSEVMLLKGFINAAVSFELHKRGRFKQSQKVWSNYLKYRPLLFKIDSQYLNSYYQLSRYVESIHKTKIGTLYAIR